jgi:hypothetical protein
METITQPTEPIKLLTRLTPAERTLIQLVRDGKAEYAANTARAMADEVLGYRPAAMARRDGGGPADIGDRRTRRQRP